MTDNEIIKALKCHLIVDGDCKGCPFDDINGEFICSERMAENALDLINRQKAEIEEMNFFTFNKFAARIIFGTEVVIYEDFKEPTNIIWTGFWERDTQWKESFDNVEVTSISVKDNALHIGICYDCE